MINREITYERNVQASYMKIPAVLEENFDEKLMLKQVVRGTLKVEKYYESGRGEYWYNISGKQALDAYCRVNPIDLSFFENLILRFCEQIEILEWCLLDTNCLKVDPELIFIGNGGEEIAFVIYPDNQTSLAAEVQQLFEFLLTKIKHGTPELVKLAYQLYERILSGEFTVSELKGVVLNNRLKMTGEDHLTLQTARRELQERKAEETPEAAVQEQKTEEKAEEPFLLQAERLSEYFREKIRVLYQRVEKILKKDTQMVKGPVIVYPTEEIQEKAQEEHPTICIGSVRAEPKGVLSCCDGGYPDFCLERNGGILGKGKTATYRIDRDTISQMHARIDYQEKKYLLEDLNSTNGTYVNDVLLGYKQPYVLQRGDILRFADISYRFD